MRDQAAGNAQKEGWIRLLGEFIFVGMILIVHPHADNLRGVSERRQILKTSRIQNRAFFGESSRPLQALHPGSENAQKIQSFQVDEFRAAPCSQSRNAVPLPSDKPHASILLELRNPGGHLFLMRTHHKLRITGITVKRTQLIATVSAAVLLAVLRSIAAPADATPDPKLLEKAKEIHKRIVAFDSHLDLPFDYAGAAADGKTQFDLPKVERGQLKGAALAVFVPQGPRTPEGYAKALADANKKYELIKGVAEQNPDRAALAYSPADVRRLAGEKKFAVVISILNAYPLVDLAAIDEWYKRGVRDHWPHACGEQSVVGLIAAQCGSGRSPE